jgi:hypothetical protein
MSERYNTSVLTPSETEHEKKIEVFDNKQAAHMPVSQPYGKHWSTTENKLSAVDQPTTSTTTFNVDHCTTVETKTISYTGKESPTEAVVNVNMKNKYDPSGNNNSQHYSYNRNLDPVAKALWDEEIAQEGLVNAFVDLLKDK